MGDCSICLGALFSHDPVPSSSHAPSATPRTTIQLGAPLEVCALPCGHVFHLGCTSSWFRNANRNAWSCPLCRKRCTPEDQKRLLFDGDPWADEREAALKTSLGRAVRRLAEKASATLGVDSHGRALEGFKRDVEGAISLVKERAEDSGEGDSHEEAWLALVHDPELKAAFVSLASAIETLNGKLHYTHRMTSLHETVSKLEAAATEHANELHAAEAAHSKALDDFRAKAADKMERERARRKDKEAERDREWRGKEKSWEAKLALAEQRVREEVAEKKKLRDDAASLDSSLNARLHSLNVLKQTNSKLTGRLELAKQGAAKLQDRIKALEDDLASAKASARDEDDMLAGFDDSAEIYDDDIDADGFMPPPPPPLRQANVTDDSLEITMNDISWQSEPEVFAAGRSLRPFGQQPSKLSRLAASSSSSSATAGASKPPPLRASSSANYPDPPPSSDKPRPTSSFTSGPRHKPPPPKPKARPATTAAKSKVADRNGQLTLDFSGGQGMALALGERKRRRVDVVSGVL